MKIFIKLTLAIFIICIFQSCSTSHETLAFEKIPDFGQFAIDFRKSRYDNRLMIDAGYRRGKPFFKSFDYLLDNKSCDTIIKEETNHYQKTVSYYFLTDNSNFDTPLSEADIFLLNKLKPVVDSLHFCQSPLIKNAKGFKIITKEQVKKIFIF